MLLALGWFEPVHAARAGTSMTPVQKVIQMLTDMVAKGNAEKQNEAKVFEDYAHWVHGQKRDTEYSIKKAKEEIEKLIAEIDKMESDIKTLSADIDELDGEIASWEADQKAATELRTAQNAEYMKTEADYSESLDALDRAIMVLSSASADVPQASALLQELVSKVPAVQPVLALLQTSQAPSGAPAVNAYEFQSGGIIDMLKKFKKKFKAELEDVVKAEMNSAHAYEMEMLHLGDNIESAKTDRNEKAELRADLSTKSAQAKATLTDTKASLAEDEKYLADVKATFTQKQAAFEENQKTRSEEIMALEKAVEILSSESVAGHAAKHLPGFVQSRAVSLVQLGTAQERSNLRQRVAEFLQVRANSLSSKILALAAVQIAESPFAKVIQMIKELIARLEEEAEAEASHKAWCDDELHKNKKKRDLKSSEVSVLKAKMEQLDAEIKTLAGQIAVLAKEQQELSVAMQEATKTREVEKEENEATIKDAKEALVAVDAALAVLKEFYSKQGAFLQQKQVPEMAKYTGMQGSTGGVIGMIEVISSDFARLKSETEADESQAQKEYDEFMKVSKADRESKHKEEFDKTMLKDKKEFDMDMADKDRAAAQEELDFALEYYDKLKPECIEVHVSYEERAKRRQEEIDALNQAYKILSGEAA
jgi:chromosome segregation ATPase